MYRIICDRCGKEYGDFSELYQLDRGHYRISRYANVFDDDIEIGNCNSRSICLCPTCEDLLDSWIGLGTPNNTCT